MSRLPCRTLGAILAAALSLATSNPATAARVFLKDGRILRGRLAPTSGVADIPKAAAPDGSGPLQLLLVIDDELRRTFISKRQILEIRQDDPDEVTERFRLIQPVLRSGQEIVSLGPIVSVEPFDEYGRRIWTMNSPKGPVPVIQCITEITPHWTKVEAHTHVWDMRMATSSIPREILDKILYKQIDTADVDDRRRIASFYLQSERYEDASAEVQSILADFPGQADVQEQLKPLVQRLNQMGATRLLGELQRRRKAGQHRLVFESLDQFPSEDVAGEILQAVRETIQQYETDSAELKEVKEKFDLLLQEIEDDTLRQEIAHVQAEIFAELNFNTLDRMAAFRQFAHDDSIGPPQRLSLAISGWLVGTNSATENLPVALSLFRVRTLIHDYLSTADTLGRARIFEQFRSEEGATVPLVARLLALMTPPLPMPEPDSQKLGFFELEVPGPDPALPISYLVQLPPEYDPHRRYPTIVALHSAGNDASRQINWWAPQASRHGYIVLAPRWAKQYQKRYGYTFREHAAVLYTLRDAFRRLAIDTDRVFLSGYSQGGDAAWDMALAHPDLWAGVITVAARSDRYCTHYWETALRLPFYVVGGEKDGRWIVDNARDLDRYLRHGYNATVVEFQGRGHERFSDEILRIFDWMGRLKRDFFPREFKVKSMRPRDNFFWWIELRGLPARSMVDPLDWPGRSPRPAITDAKITAANGIYVKAPAEKVIVWITPDMLDFDKPATITVNGRRLSFPSPADAEKSPSARRPSAARSRFAEPDLETLIEDVRTRADRQHPFWVKVEN